MQERAVNYDTATLDELQAEFIRLAEVVVSASNDRQEILKVMEKRKASVAAKERVRAMTVLDKDAMFDVLKEGRAEVKK